MQIKDNLATQLPPTNSQPPFTKQAYRHSESPFMGVRNLFNSEKFHLTYRDKNFRNSASDASGRSRWTRCPAPVM
jgi:hypothetical protein